VSNFVETTHWPQMMNTISLHADLLTLQAYTLMLLLPSLIAFNIDFKLYHFCAIVYKTVCPMLSDRCLSCLSVTLVYCGQTVGWIKMKLGTQVGLGPGHIALDGDPAPPPPKGQSPPILGPYMLWPNGCMDQDDT